jgi:glycosyltransferase involved in cell wall biosynthesis
MRLHFFLKGPMSEATPRYRGYLLAAELRKRGADVHTYPALRPWWGAQIAWDRCTDMARHSGTFLRAGSADVFYLVRTIYQSDFIRLLLAGKRLRGIRFIFDFDDPKYLTAPETMVRLTRAADAVVVGSHALADWARQHNSQVALVPTSVPFGVYSRFARDRSRANGELVVGWVGIGPNHLDNLPLVVPALRRLHREGVPVRFVLFGARGRQAVRDVFAAPLADGVSVDFVDELEWERPEAIARALSGLDVGVMPLADNEINRAKCAFKAIEYMACGVPTVASAVGESLYLIDDDRNGLLARTAEDWYVALKRLFLDPDLRRRLGEAGQETVRERYSLEANAPRILEIAKAVVAKPRRRLWPEPQATAAVQALGEGSARRPD